MARHTKAQRAAIAQRRADAVELQLAGVDWLTIGRKLAADPSINTDRIAYPQGYGADLYAKGKEPPDDATLIRYTCKDVQHALNERYTNLGVSVGELRLVHHMRLERLFFIAFRRAVRDGDLPAVDLAVRIL
ncbi:hypothetical protein ACWCYY_11955 [Kitasatospora sp. NPDC001664]